LWKGENTEQVTYCLGIVGDNVYVAGPDVLKCYCYSSTRQGSLVWAAQFKGSHGRGCLVGDGIYVPVEDSIVRYALDGRQTGKVIVKFTTDREDPVGNLVTDGQTIFALGPERVFALNNIEQQLSFLDEKIAAGDATLHRRRMLLRGRLGQLDGAISDLRVVYANAVKEQGPREAQKALVDALDDLELSSRAPLVSLELLAGGKGALAALSADDVKQMPASRSRRTTAELVVALAAVRDQRLAGATSLVLSAIRVWPDPDVLSTAGEALRRVTTAADAKMLRQAIASDRVPLRVASIAALARVQGAAAQADLVPLLADANGRVRVAAARALADQGDRRALQALVELLESTELDVRLDAIRTLQALTGERFDYIAYLDQPAERKTSVARWREWLTTSGQTAKLKFPLDFVPYKVGRLLISNQERGMVVELDIKGDQVWSSPAGELAGVGAVQGLPNGNRLISSTQGLYLAELNPKGQEVWRVPQRLPVYPLSIERLESGNTLVCGTRYGDSKGAVIELDREGRAIPGKEFQFEGQPSCARRLPNGNTLVCLPYNGRVVEFDAAGKEAPDSALTGLMQPQTARRLPNGNTLVCIGGRRTYGRVGGRLVPVGELGQVVEYDAKKEIKWTFKEGLAEALDCERLENGDTVILDTRGIRQVDQKGKVLWSKEMTGCRRLSAY
jgi:hypothetical protein